MPNSNQKGKRGERMACKLLESLGWKARRSQQYSGVRSDETSADILTNIQGIRFEVKYGYSVELWHKQARDWIETCKEETPEHEQWAILYKKTGSSSWTIIFEIKGVLVQSHQVKDCIELIESEAFKVVGLLG